MALVDLLLPQRCLVCARPGIAVCDGCRIALPRVEAPLCSRCGAPTSWPVGRCAECAGRRLPFATARAALVYEEAVRRFVAAWKEDGLRRLAAVAADLVADQLDRPDVGVLAFVPPERDRALKRGHHPAERLACELAVRWRLPVERLLERQGSSVPQRGLTLAERRGNVSGAFSARRRAPASVALIDDVYTSGATASAAASALRKAGARRVEVVTFARAVRDR